MPKKARKHDVGSNPTPAPKLPSACPSCGAPLEIVGRISGQALSLCHNERKAFKGDPPVEVTAEKTRHPSLYGAVTEKHETTINIEDIVLT